LQTVEFSIADGSELLKRLRQLSLFRWIPQQLTYKLILAVLVAWVPLLIFTAHKGLAVGDKVQIPFLADLVQYARFLVALPCTIALGEFVNPRLKSVLNSFIRSGIVSRKDLARFQNAILWTSTLTSSLIAEMVILSLVYFYMALRLHRQVSASISSWNHPCNGVLVCQTSADWWFLWISMPLLLFAGFLWVWRLGVWAYFLFLISRLELRVVATHPDGAGGLNFVNVGMRRFSVLVFAISCILCASIGEEILFNGASLHSFELELAFFFIFCVAVILAPTMVFTPLLIRSKLEYWRRYGPLASSYVQEFDEKWALQTGDCRPDLLGSPDIQSLADLRHSYSGISEMRTMLPDLKTIGIFALAYIVPVLPLLASIISFRRVLSETYTLLLR
jgi:hypothetical protein